MNTQMVGDKGELYNAIDSVAVGDKSKTVIR
jgi:hypothetical protein